VRVNGRFKVIYNQDGKVADYFANRVINNSSLACVVRYMVEFVGLDLVGCDLKLNVAEYDSLRSLNSNNSMGTIKTRFGLLYVKKINSSNVNVDYALFSDPKYNIIAGMHGFVRLLNDDNFSHGIILESCYPVENISYQNMICALQAIRKLHSDGYIHGDCNRHNIMANRFGSLVLVDPVNLISGRIMFINPHLYQDISILSDLKAFVYSCFEIQSAILKTNMENLLFTNVESVGFNLKSGVKLLDVLSQEYSDLLLFMGVGDTDEVFVNYDSGIEVVDMLQSMILDDNDESGIHSESDGNE